MIIFGFRGVTMTRERGFFDCPDCLRSTEYHLRGVRNFFTLYFIPVIPLTWEPGEEHVRCDECKTQFPPGVLDGTWPPEDYVTEVESFHFLVRRFALVPMLLAGGVVQPSDKQRVLEICQECHGGQVDLDELEHEIQYVQKNGVDVSMEQLARVARSLDHAQKQLMLTAAWQIAAAEGVLDPAQWKVLADLGETLGLNAVEINDVIAAAEQA